MLQAFLKQLVLRLVFRLLWKDSALWILVDYYKSGAITIRGSDFSQRMNEIVDGPLDP